MTGVIHGQGLTRTYGKGDTEVVALRDATLTVARGEVAALLGPSGSGKSTLLLALGLLSLPQRGEVHIDGRPVARDGRALVDLASVRRAQMGFVFQKSNLIPFLTAAENVAVALQLNGVGGRASRWRVQELLDYLGLAERAGHYPDQLSGGQQQRVAVARALANKPAVILADEPTAALDSQRGRAVMELMRKVAHEQSTAVLVVTHDHRTLDVFDTIYEMEDGRLGPARREHGTLAPPLPVPALGAG